MSNLIGRGCTIVMYDSGVVQKVIFQSVKSPKGKAKFGIWGALWV